MYLWGGIISDNKDGIMGVIGVSDYNVREENRKIFDYHEFQQMTQIDLNENKFN